MRLLVYTISISLLFSLSFSDHVLAGEKSSLENDTLTVSPRVSRLSQNVLNAVEADSEQKMLRLLERAQRILESETSTEEDRFLLLQLISKLNAAKDEPDILAAALALEEALKIDVGSATYRNVVRSNLINLTLYIGDYERTKAILEALMVDDVDGEVGAMTNAAFAATSLLLGENEQALEAAKKAVEDVNFPELYDLYRISLNVNGMKSDAVKQGEILSDHFPDYIPMKGVVDSSLLVLNANYKLNEAWKTIKRSPPEYPQRCAKNHQNVEEVRVGYDLSNEGKVVNVRINSSTDSCFDKASLLATSKWEYPADFPVKLDGKDLEVTFRYLAP